MQPLISSRQTLSKSFSRYGTWALLVVACVASAQVQPGTPAVRPAQWEAAQVAPPAQTIHHPAKMHRLVAGHPATQQAMPVQQSTLTTIPATASQPTVAPNLLNEPAQPAVIKLEAGKLAIRAENASLSQILEDLAGSSGMKLEGLSQDQRVFGSYGPGEPRDVLTALLESTGYNVLMVGNNSNGVPRQLSLTHRSSGQALPGSNNTQPVSQDQTQEEDADQGEVQPDNEPPPPPNSMPVAPDGQPTPNGVRTPQQLLEQLQRMHQAQPPQ